MGGGKIARWLQGGSREAPRRLQLGSRSAPGDQCSFGWPSLLRSYYVASNEVTEDLTRRWARGPANCEYSGQSARERIVFGRKTSKAYPKKVYVSKHTTLGVSRERESRAQILKI